MSTEAAPAPDPALPLRGRWRRHRHHAAVGSTNDVGLASLAAGEPPGLVVTADRQTAGRGRRGRVWSDLPDGASLASSVTLAPGAGGGTLLPLVAGLAVTDALAGVGAALRLKWPNDVVAERGDGLAKCNGVLAESVATGVVLGVGWNVDFRGLPGLAGATSAAAEAGGDVDRWALLAAYLVALDRRLGAVDRDGPATQLDDYRARSTTLGRDVTAVADGGEVRGRAVDVDLDGALVLAVGSGRRVRVTAGEVVHLR